MEDGLTSTPRQEPSWGKRGGWGKVTMICCGVEFSIAGGGGEMVCASLLIVFFLSSCVHCFRYKKPHAARAMEKTKPINPNK